MKCCIIPSKFLKFGLLFEKKNQEASFNSNGPVSFDVGLPRTNSFYCSCQYYNIVINIIY